MKLKNKNRKLVEKRKHKNRKLVENLKHKQYSQWAERLKLKKIGMQPRDLNIANIKPVEHFKGSWPL